MLSSLLCPRPMLLGCAWLLISAAFPMHWKARSVGRRRTSGNMTASSCRLMWAVIIYHVRLNNSSVYCFLVVLKGIAMRVGQYMFLLLSKDGLARPIYLVLDLSRSVRDKSSGERTARVCPVVMHPSLMKTYVEITDIQH